MHDDLVFLVDVDNTLLHNDTVMDDFRRLLLDAFGLERERRYWDIFEQLSAEVGYADYLGALQRYRTEYPREAHLLEVALFLLDYPFANRLFPNSLDVIEHLRRWGPTVILTDGDVVFQPRKIERSGLLDAVDGHTLIYVHKELELEHIRRRYPAKHYVVVDDKLHILAAIKKIWRRLVTAIFPRQGHYAYDRQILAKYPPADTVDLTVERIGELLDYDLKSLIEAGCAARPRVTPR